MTYAAFPNLAKHTYDLDPKGGVIRCPALDGILWMTHGFTTRKFAPPEAGVFDLMDEVRRRLTPGGSRLFCGEQVHGARVEAIDPQCRYAGAAGVKTRGSIVQLPGTDGLVVADPALPVAVQTADCVPLLLADVRARRLAVVHVGWRGAIARIAENAVAEIKGQGSEPEDLVAWMGPAISMDAYEIGPELAARFQTAFPDYGGIVVDHRLDLVLLTAWQLRAAGLPPSQIHAANYCTADHVDTCYSYRAEGNATGRMALYAMLLSREPLDRRK